MRAAAGERSKVRVVHEEGRENFYQCSSCVSLITVRAAAGARGRVRAVQGEGHLRHMGGCDGQHTHHGLHGRLQAPPRHQNQARTQVSRHHKI